MSEERFYIKNLQPIREFCLNSDKEDVYKYIYSLQQENKKLNHYKLLYQKVKERNDKAIECLEQELEYSKKDCVPARRIACEKILKKLKGNNETK